MKLTLRAIAVLSFIVSIAWMIFDPGFEPLLAFLGGIATLITSLVIDKQADAETTDQRNRRIILGHVENFWVKGILEKSLHGAALLELGIKEDADALNYPWAIKREATKETLPAGISMQEIFQEIGLGRSLLILGAPGSGKTTMLLELTRQLIERARQDMTEPIPVVFNLASWTEKLTLANWLAVQLNLIYSVPKKVAPDWVKENKMLLLLDGLDEVRQESRDKCVDTINQFRKENGLTGIAVCSRIQDYADLMTRLSFDGAIKIQPLTSIQVDEYFKRLGKELAGITQVLEKDNVLREMAETPLFLSIMTLAYQGKPAEMIGSEEINALTRRKHLFDTYIEKMFKRVTRTKNEVYAPEQTKHWLAWLADKMVNHGQTLFYIENLQPNWLASSKEVKQQKSILDLPLMLLGGLLAGLVGWLLDGLFLGLFYGIFFGIGSGFAFSLFIMSRDFIEPTDRLRLSRGKAVRGLISGLFAGLFIGLVIGLFGGLIDLLGGKPIGGLVGGVVDELGGGLLGWLGSGLLGGLLVGLLGGLLSGLFEGLDNSTIDTRNAPGQGLRSSMINMLISGLVFGLVTGLLIELVYGLILGGAGLVFGLVTGLGTGMVTAQMFGCTFLIQHFSLRWLLFRFKRIPWNYVRFLDYCTDLIFLRRVGGGYIFVHRLLMEHFAAMYTEGQK